MTQRARLHVTAPFSVGDLLAQITLSDGQTVTRLLAGGLFEGELPAPAQSLRLLSDDPPAPSAAPPAPSAPQGLRVAVSALFSDTGIPVPPDGTLTVQVVFGAPCHAPPPVVVCWADEFDDGIIGGEWCPGSDPGVTIDEPDGHLRFALSPTDWGMGSGSGWVSTCNWVPLLGMDATTEVLAVPQVSPHTEAYIEAGNDDVRLGLGVLNGELYAFVWDGMTYAGVSFQPYEPAAHRYLRVVGTEDGLVGESSPDGMAWAHVYTHPTDLEGHDGYAALGSWGELAPLGPDEATFERFELCWLEG